MLSENETDFLFEYAPAGPFLKSANKTILQETFVPALILVLLGFVLGIPGNIITLFVYITRMRKNATRIFILALTASDLLNCVLTMPIEIVIITNFWTIDMPNTCKLSRTLAFILNYTSCMVLIGVAAERYRKICTPLKPPFSEKTVKNVCLLCVFASIILSLPAMWLYGTFVKRLPGPVNNSYVIGQTCLIENNHVNSWLSMIFAAYSFVSVCVMPTVLIVLYSFIVKAARQRQRLAKIRKCSSGPNKTPQDSNATLDETDDSQDTSSGNHNLPKTESARHTYISKKNTFSLKTFKKYHMNRTTVMLLAITVAFVASFFPFDIIMILRGEFRPNIYESMTPAEQSLYQLFLRSYVVQSAINPILYGFLNKEFRRKTKMAMKSLTFGMFQGNVSPGQPQR